VREQLQPQCREYLHSRVGFVDTVIGRMVPAPTPEMRAQDVGFIRVEPYKELPVDRSAFIGEIPHVAAMIPQTNFEVFTARKLYIHNCGHAVLAYSGFLRGFEFGYQALADAAIRKLLDAALAESMAGIVAEHGVEADWLEEHVADLKQRFGNRMLGDTVFRLGRDPLRKLSPNDRLVGAAELYAKSGQTPRALAWAIGAALHFNPAEDPSARELQRRIEEKGVRATLHEVSSIDPNSDCGRNVIAAYEALANDPAADFNAALH
jgi:mannitol-1-phosphate 5-dehydrogenase